MCVAVLYWSPILSLGRRRRGICVRSLTEGLPVSDLKAGRGFVGRITCRRMRVGLEFLVRGSRARVAWRTARDAAVNAAVS